MQTDVAIFGSGCFWCSEAVFASLRGVLSVMPGYAGGQTLDPTYDHVCSGETGHAEVLRVEFDPAKISYDDLLTVFFASHNPTTLNRQGNDVGTQYRSIILTMNDEQARFAHAFIQKLNLDGEQVVTEIAPLEKFYEAEAYHHHYFERNPEKAYCQFVINPKLEHVRKKFSELMEG